MRDPVDVIAEALNRSSRRSDRANAVQVLAALRAEYGEMTEDVRVHVVGGPRWEEQTFIPVPSERSDG